MRETSTTSSVTIQPSPERSRPETESASLPSSAASCSRAVSTTRRASPGRAPEGRRSSSGSSASSRSTGSSRGSCCSARGSSASEPQPLEQLVLDLLELLDRELAPLVAELGLGELPTDRTPLVQLSRRLLGDLLRDPHGPADRRQRQRQQARQEPHQLSPGNMTKLCGGSGPRYLNVI